MQNDSVSQQLWAMLCTHKDRREWKMEGGRREGRRENDGVMKEGRRKMRVSHFFHQQTKSIPQLLTLTWKRSCPMHSDTSRL